MRKLHVMGLAAAIAIVAAVFFFLKISAPRPSDKPNLILISLDTLRADRLGTYKYSRATSPFLDSWASGAAVFEHAVTAAPWTLPSHVSIFTGLYPTSHGVNEAKKRSIGESTELFTEILQRNGYQNFAYVAGGYVGKRYGFARGFDSFIYNSGERSNKARGFPRTVTMALEKLEKRDPSKPFFLFLHTYAVHCPYTAPEPYRDMFNSPDAEPIDTSRCDRFNGKEGFTKGHAQFLSDRYDGSVRFVDDTLKTLFEGLEKQGVKDNTFIIITSDHGESFLEHGRIGHSESLYKELLMVPLIVSGPGIKPQRISEAVNLVDIFPTVLDLLGFPASTQPDGHTLAALLHGQQESFSRPPYQLSELHRGKMLRSLIDPVDEHFILDLETNTAQLFKLPVDPLETKDLATSMPDRISEWRSILDRLSKGLHERPTGKMDPATKEQIEQLKTLGYL
ncbi:MAG: sulfatase [Deltaproteobacteria bacterium]|nr:sulfatase [Deltaproteobacteria bacterium]